MGKVYGVCMSSDKDSIPRLPIGTKGLNHPHMTHDNLCQLASSLRSMLKLSLQQTLETHRVVRNRGSHVF
jgi:hypothetical protein